MINLWFEMQKILQLEENVFLTKKSGLKIGTETFCSQNANIVFENNDIIESDRDGNKCERWSNCSGCGF